MDRHIILESDEWPRESSRHVPSDGFPAIFPSFMLIGYILLEIFGAPPLLGARTHYTNAPPGFPCSLGNVYELRFGNLRDLHEERRAS